MTIEQPCEPFKLNAAEWWAEVERLERRLEEMYELAPAEWIERTWARCDVCRKVRRIAKPHTHCADCKDADCRTCAHMEQLTKEAKSDVCPF